MESTQKQTTQKCTFIIRLIIIHTCVTFILGWFTPLVLVSLGYPLSVGRRIHISHDEVATLGYTISKYTQEYHNQYLTFPEPSLLAALSDRARLLEYSAGLLETPTSEELVDGLRNASVILDRLWPELVDFKAFSDTGIYRLNAVTELATYIHKLDTETAQTHITTVIRTIDDMKGRVDDLRNVLTDMGSTVSSIARSIQIEKKFLDNDQKDIENVKYFIKRLSVIWLGVTRPRSNGRWERDVLDDCQAVVYEMSSIGLSSEIAARKLNETLQKIEEGIFSIGML